METDVFDKSSCIDSACVLSFASNCPFSSSEIFVFVFTYCRKFCKTKTSKWMFSDLAEIELIHSKCIVISGFITLQKALVMMQFYWRSIHLSVCVLLCIFTCEFLSEFSTNMLHMSGYFCIFGFGVHETANF